MRVVATILLASALAFGQSEAQQRGKAIVNEALSALGGDAFRNMQDRVETGRAYSFYRDRLTGLAIAKISTRYLDPRGASTKDKLFVRERQAFGKKEDSIVLFTENDAYQLTYRGAKPMAADKVERYRDSTLHNIFYILHGRLNEPGLIIEHKGSDVIDNKPVETVDITDADNRTVTIFFSKNSKLPVKQVFFRRNPVTRERTEEVTYFNKYRDVGGGVQWPFHILRERDGDKIFELFSEGVEINQNLTDELFTLPGGMKVLQPDKPILSER